MKERINYTTTKRIKRRLDSLSEDMSIPRNDLINQAVQDYLDKQDASYYSPDYIGDRLSQIFNVLISMSHTIEELVIAQKKQNEDRNNE